LREQAGSERARERAEFEARFRSRADAQVTCAQEILDEALQEQDSALALRVMKLLAPRR
jgi:hypothetical protein